MDPPYNTEQSAEEGNNQNSDDKGKFTYNDKFSRTGWLNMMNERLLLAKELLRDDGLILVSIDDNEQAYLKVLMDEIFGENNFVSNISWIKKRGPGSNTSQVQKIVKNCEYILIYSKDIYKVKFNYKVHNKEKLKKLGYINKDEYFDERGYYKITDLYHPASSGAFKYSESLDYQIKAPDGTEFMLHKNLNKPKSGCYTWSKDSFDIGNSLGFILIKKNSKGFWQAYRKQYQFVKFDPKSKTIVNKAAGQEYENYIDENIYTSEGGEDIKKILMDKNQFTFPKPTSLIKYLLSIRSTKDSRILDFFAGSGTTGHAVEELNNEDCGKRTYTLVTNNENNIGDKTTYERLWVSKIGVTWDCFK
ncbi:site-specific DNA-methyltransferase [Mycoplasma sp. NEAQ87857]|uniref:site-specific DNA-methyltransferase n=1 Tax=Mycoplasma sp. NEAQ87857 TaxID=2683967 RepID=UPI001E45F97F|nr:site-specific DNA-methyltransferase [Mycoplasma sp. NEAQ87857]